MVHGGSNLFFLPPSNLLLDPDAMHLLNWELLLTSLPFHCLHNSLQFGLISRWRLSWSTPTYRWGLEAFCSGCRTETELVEGCWVFRISFTAEGFYHCFLVSFWALRVREYRGHLTGDTADVTKLSYFSDSWQWPKAFPDSVNQSKISNKNIK